MFLYLRLKKSWKLMANLRAEVQISYEYGGFWGNLNNIWTTSSPNLISKNFVREFYQKNIIVLSWFFNISKLTQFIWESWLKKIRPLTSIFIKNYWMSSSSNSIKSARGLQDLVLRYSSKLWLSDFLLLVLKIEKEISKIGF